MLPHVAPRVICRLVSQIDILLKEAAVTLRGLRREPGFTLVAILLLALGIGLTSAVFTLLWQVVYERLPVPEPSRLFVLDTNVTHMGREDSDSQAAVFSAPLYRYLTRHFPGAEMAARHGELVNIETPEGPRHLRAELVSGNFFVTVGVKPVVGRAILSGDDSVSNPRYVAVLSYAFWQEAFGGSIGAWNSSIRVNGLPFRIVGIGPPHFTGVIAGSAPQVFVPMSVMPFIDPGWNKSDDWSVRWLNLFFRLPPERSAAQAEARINPIYRRGVREELAAETPQPADYLAELSHERVSLLPASQGVHGMLDQWRQPLRILQWLTAVVLLLTCINVAGLAVVRAIKQRRETLVRYAMGASRAALVRLYLMQAVILSLAGGLAGVWLARWGALLLLHLGRVDRGGALSSGLNSYALGVHWLTAIAAGLLVGVFPAWHAGRVDLAAGLAESASTHSATRSHTRTRRALAALQIALSLFLLIAAGLFVKSLHKLVSVPVGFNPDRLMLFSVDPKLYGSTTAASQLLYSNIQRRLQQTPGVESVTYGTGGPFPQEGDSGVLIPSGGVEKHAAGMASIVGPRYFATLGIRILAGREFDGRDRAGTPNGVIINETMARKLFGNRDAVGQPVGIFNGIDPNRQATIIGVVPDYHISWKRSHAAQLYTAAQQAPRVSAITFYVRHSGGSALTEQTLRDLVRREAPLLSAYDVQTMSVRMEEFASGDRAMALLISVFAALALTISLIGIYGVIAYSSSLRDAEFGVRFAVGAQSRDVMWLVFREAIVIVAVGLLLAFPAVWFGLLLVRTQLYDVSLRDPALFLAATLLLVGSSFLAALAPASRAARMNIQTALRHN